MPKCAQRRNREGALNKLMRLETPSTDTNWRSWRSGSVRLRNHKRRTTAAENGRRKKTMKRTTSKGSSADSEFIRDCISADISHQLDDLQEVLRKACRVGQQDVAFVKETMS